jgi:hypothetical protein
MITTVFLLFVMVFSNISTPVYATCTNPTSCPLVLDDIHYVFGHGAKINITDSSPGTSPTIDLASFTSTGTPISSVGGLPMHLQGDHVFLTSPPIGGTYSPTYVMFNGQPSSQTDPPTLNVGNTVPTLPTNPNYFTVTYHDGLGNSVTFPNNISIEKNYSVVTDFPYPTAGAQPLKTVIISCPTGRAGDSSDYICNAWKTPNGLSIPYTDSLGTKATYFWSCNNNPDPNQNIFKIPPVDSPCPLTTHKDVYVEIDYMYNHKPSRQALLDVINSYKSHQVYLHILLDDEIPHKVLTSGPSNGGDTTQFTKIKNIYFGNSTERNPPGTFPNGWCTATTAAQCTTDILTAKRQVFHYALFGHSQSANPTSSGISEVSSVSPYTATNDIFITLGAFSYHVGSLDQQEGTFMHELGHNLGLAHGGPYAINGNPISDANDNCKPNYLSVMSWSRQFSALFGIHGRGLDYSTEGGSNFMLDSTAGTIVNERAVSNTNQYIVYSMSGTTWSPEILAKTPDWDSDNENTETVPEPDVWPSSPPNVGTLTNSTPGGNGVVVTITCPDSSNRVLNTYDDWSNLKFDMTPTSSFSDGAGATERK